LPSGVPTTFLYAVITTPCVLHVLSTYDYLSLLCITSVLYDGQLLVKEITISTSAACKAHTHTHRTLLGRITFGKGSNYEISPKFAEENQNQNKQIDRPAGL
jgi:hypothetical protein